MSFSLTEEQVKHLRVSGYEVIPRAQYEALMAAAKELLTWLKEYDSNWCQCEECVRRRRIAAALRAAGILGGE